MNWYLIQGIGLLGLLFVALPFQSNKRVRILLCLCIGQICFALHFGLLGAWIGSIMNVISALRSFIFSYRERKSWASNRFWLYFFLLVFWISGLKLWVNFYSILPIIAQSIETLGFWMKKTKMIRFINLLPPSLWFFYNCEVGSWAGIITVVVYFCSILVGIIRFDIKRKW